MDLENRRKRFVSEQDNLDALYWLQKGISYREIGEKIGRPHSFVQRVNDFLRNDGLTTGGQWRIDVNALGMTKTFKFYEYSPNRPREVIDNDDFLSYFADIKKGKSGHLALYTFPNEVEPKTGGNITPFYYNIPRFTAPLLNHDLSLDKFTEIYKDEDNENPLPPRGETINPDIIHIELARYIELFGIPENKGNNEDAQKLHDSGLTGINFSKLVDIITDDIREELGGTVDVTYDIVRNRYNDMHKKHVVYPGFGLDMRKLGYTLSFCWIKTKEIYRVIRTFSQFNVICALAYANNKHLLHLQYPKNKEIDVFDIFNDLDPENEVFRILKVHNNRLLPHPYYFEKERERFF